MVGFLDFSDFYSLSPDSGSSARGIIHKNQAMLLNAWVTVLELNLGQVSSGQHSGRFFG